MFKVCVCVGGGGVVVVEFHDYKERNMAYMGHPRPSKEQNMTVCHLTAM